MKSGSRVSGGCGGGGINWRRHRHRVGQRSRETMREDEMEGRRSEAEKRIRSPGQRNRHEKEQQHQQL